MTTSREKVVSGYKDFGKIPVEASPYLSLNRYEYRTTATVIRHWGPVHASLTWSWTTLIYVPPYTQAVLRRGRLSALDGRRRKVVPARVELDICDTVSLLFSLGNRVERQRTERSTSILVTRKLFAGNLRLGRLAELHDTLSLGSRAVV